MFGDLFHIIRNIFIVLCVLASFGLWKIVEIVIKKFN